MVRRPVYRVLHRPLTLCGVERRLFILSLMGGAVTFTLSYSLLAGVLIFGVAYGFVLWATKRDPEMLRIFLPSSKVRRRYDPGKHDRVDLVLTSW
jgi:type IV secretory pathway TrbD component